MNRALLTSIFALLLASSRAQENLNQLPPYISYEFYEPRCTINEHREVATTIFLSGDGFLGFRYWERVSGSTMEKVSTVRFFNEYQRKATEKEQSELVQALLAAGLLELKSEEKGGDYFSHLNFRIQGREALLFFYSPPISGQRKAIHDILLQFARTMGIDRPSDLAKSTTISEGDTVSPREVKLVDLLAEPAKFHGKRVSVIGFYHGEFEGSSLSVNERASRRSDYKNSIWRGEPSSFAKAFAVFGKNNSWVRVDGVFLKGPAGHMSLWPGEIVRLTRVRPVLPPMDWSGLKYLLSNVFLYLSGLLVWPFCAFIWRKKRRRTTALRWVFCAELLCLLIVVVLGLLSNIDLGFDFLWFWLWVAVNLGFTVAAVGAARYDSTRSQLRAV